MMKKAGTTKSRAIVPTVIPPTTPTANARFPLAPAPPAITSGIIPAIIVTTVMRIGRRRSRQASNAASGIDKPCARRSDANSVMRIAVLANRPISMITPVWR